jgi:hypothetical protein
MYVYNNRGDCACDEFNDEGSKCDEIGHNVKRKLIVNSFPLDSDGLKTHLCFAWVSQSCLSWDIQMYGLIKKKIYSFNYSLVALQIRLHDMHAITFFNKYLAGDAYFWSRLCNPSWNIRELLSLGLSVKLSHQTLEATCLPLNTWTFL